MISYADNAVLSNTTYFYRVRAFRTVGGVSLPSNEVSITTPVLTPIAPSNLRVMATARTTVNLRWNDNSTNESGFYIERSTDGVTFTRVLTRGVNIVNGQVTGLTPNTLYYFRVQAYNAYGVSVYSNIIFTTTLP